jgi:hypothetical protein
MGLATARARVLGRTVACCTHREVDVDGRRRDQDRRSVDACTATETSSAVVAPKAATPGGQRLRYSNEPAQAPVRAPGCRSVRARCVEQLEAPRSDSRRLPACSFSSERSVSRCSACSGWGPTHWFGTGDRVGPSRGGCGAPADLRVLRSFPSSRPRPGCLDRESLSGIRSPCTLRKGEALQRDADEWIHSRPAGTLSPPRGRMVRGVLSSRSNDGPQQIRKQPRGRVLPP